MAQKNTEENRSKQRERRAGQDRRKQDIPVDKERRKKPDDRRDR